MGLYSSKIDQDIAKTVKIQSLRNYSFCKKNCVFLNENCYFSKFYVLQFLLCLGQFLSCIGSFYHFGILKVSSLKWHTVCLNKASNIVTMIEKPSSIFFSSVSTLIFFSDFVSKQTVQIYFGLRSSDEILILFSLNTIILENSAVFN